MAASGGHCNRRFSISSIGFLNSSLLRGRSLSSWATPSRFSALWMLYDLPFTSSRPDRYLTDADGDRVSEIVPFKVDEAPTFDHLDTLVEVANYAAGLIGVELVEFDVDDQPFTRQLVAADIAIVVAHNAQASGITAILRSLKADGIYVGTADKMQGGQWHAVVAMDPFIG
jgi:hypothetical protein